MNKVLKAIGLLFALSLIIQGLRGCGDGYTDPEEIIEEAEDYCECREKASAYENDDRSIKEMGICISLYRDMYDKIRRDGADRDLSTEQVSKLTSLWRKEINKCK